MANLEFGKELTIQKTSIPGLVLLDLPVHGDARGWFKENWQREKMTALGLPDFKPVQNNISFNDKRGVTRGIHAEPWDKFVSIAKGKVFCAWVDIREGSPTYGSVFTTELDPSKAVFVPAGVANSYQTLEDDTAYTYLVNDHWSPEAQYSSVNLADESLNIAWPIPLTEVEISEKDASHPLLEAAQPVTHKKTLIVGAYGQLGRALAKVFPDAEKVDRDTLDVSNESVFTARRWRDYSLIINAAAYTAVDLAETDEGRRDAWQANATAVMNLSKIASEADIILVHVSSDYVFDGQNELRDEAESFAPLGVYGQSKAAGDIAASLTNKHYIVRTSWVIGDGKNFVRTMKELAGKGVAPKVVDDQVGRLTFTSDLADGIKHLIEANVPFGTYNLTGDGEPASWASVAADVYEMTGHDRSAVSGVSTQEYYQGKEGIAPRPLQSTLSLDKIKATGFSPRNWKEALSDYLENE